MSPLNTLNTGDAHSKAQHCPIGGYRPTVLVVATASGLTSSSAIDQHLVTGARFAVNLDKIPTAGAECYRTVGFFDYVYVAAGVNPDRDVALARSDHLSEFSDSQKYRGFPAIPACAPK
jgi:hypothetical protein